MSSRISTHRYTASCSAELERLKQALLNADSVIIGAGAGLSTAAGLAYSGERFERDFADFIEKYRYGDMYTAVNDMRAAEALVPALIPDAAFARADVIVADANLPEETLGYIAQKAREANVPLFVDPVSAAKAPRLKAILPLIHTLKPNLLEAEALTGEKEPDAALFALRGLGVARAFLSMGADGVCFIWEGGSGSVHVDASAKVIDATVGHFVFEITGKSSKIDQFVAIIKPLGLIEICRTGIAAMNRGSQGM